MYKKVISASVVYTLLTFLQPMLSLLLQPMYLKWFTNTEYAVFALMSSYSSLITLLSTLGIGGAVFACYYDYSHNQKELDKYMGQILSFCLWANLFFTLLVFLFGPLLFALIFRADQAIQFYPYGAIATLGGMAGAIVIPYTVFLRNGNLLKLYTLLAILTAIGATVSQLGLVMVFNAGLSGALWGKTAGVVLGALLAIWLNKHLLTWRLDWHYLRGTLRFMRFNTPNSLISWMYLYFDRFLTERLLSLTLVSMYSLLHVLTSTIEMAYLAVRGAIMPFVFQSLGKNAPPEKIQQSRVVYHFYFVFTLLFASVVVAVVCNLQLLTSNTTYYPIRQCVFLYASGYIVSSLTDIANLAFYQQKQSLKLLLYTIFAVVLNVSLNIVLMPRYQLWGVVIASALTRLLFVPAMFIPNPQILKPFLHKSIYLPILTALAIMGTAFFCASAGLLPIETIGWLQLAAITTLLIIANLSYLKHGVSLTLAMVNKFKLP